MKTEIKKGDIKLMRFRDMLFQVVVKDVTTPGYGRILVLVEPVSGSGADTVENTTLLESDKKLASKVVN